MNPAAGHGEGSLRRIFRNAGWLLGAKGFGAVLSLAYLAMATRSLGPVGFGQFTLIFGLAQAIVAFVSFQTWRVVIRVGTLPLLKGERLRLSRLIFFCLIIDVAGALVGCLIAYGAVLALAGRFGWSDELARNALYFAFVMLLAVRSTAVGALRLHDRFRDGAKADATTPAMRMLGALVVVFLVGPTVTGFLIAWAVGEIVTALVYWYFVATRTGLSSRGLTLREVLGAGREEEGFWRFAILTNLNSTVSSASQQFALLAVGYVAGPAAAGFFRLAHQLGQALRQVAEMLSRSLYAEMARVMAGESQEALRKLFAQTGRLALFGGVLVILLVVFAGKPALHLIGGEAYLPAYPVLVLLGSAAAIQLIGVNFEPTLTAAGRAGTILAIRGVSTLLMIALLWWLLPKWGTIGAGIAMLIDAIFALLVLGFAARRLTNGRVVQA